MIKFNIKAISPIVGSALLLIVAVIAVVGFQNWFMSYQSGTNAKVEQEGSMGSIVSLEMITSGMMYLKGSGKIQSVNIDGVDCDISGLTDTGVNSLPMADCAKSGLNDVVIITTNGVFSQKIVLNDYVYKDECPSNYIRVPGNIDLGTKNFCVMKYEAKEDSSGSCHNGKTVNCPISQATGTPWGSMNWTDAKLECESLGSGYHLINNKEWMTIARNAEAQDINWVNAAGNPTSVGVGALKQGNTDNGIIGAYYDPGHIENSSEGVNNLGLLNLSNGNGIWDLSGNVWEQTDNLIDCSEGYPCAGMPYASNPSTGWIDLTTLDSYGEYSYDLLRPKNSLFNSSNGIGEIYSANGTTWGGDNSHIFLRGVVGTHGGVFSLRLDIGPSWAGGGPPIGFRCSWSQ